MAESVCSFLGGQPCRACRIPRVDRDTHVMNADEARALISGPLSNHRRIQPQQRAAIEHVTGEQVKPASLQMVHQEERSCQSKPEGTTAGFGGCEALVKIMLRHILGLSAGIVRALDSFSAYGF